MSSSSERGVLREMIPSKLVVFFKVVELVEATNGSKLVTRVPWENNAKKGYSFQLLMR